MISIQFYVNACITSSALAQSLYEKSSYFVFQLRQGSRLRLFRRPLHRPPCRLVCSVVFSVVRSVVHSVVRSVVRSVIHPIGALPQSSGWAFMPPSEHAAMPLLQTCQTPLSGWAFTPPSEHAAMPLLQTCYPRTLLASSPIALSSTALHFYFYFLILALRTWIAST